MEASQMSQGGSQQSTQSPPHSTFDPDSDLVAVAGAEEADESLLGSRPAGSPSRAFEEDAAPKHAEAANPAPHAVLPQEPATEACIPGSSPQSRKARGGARCCPSDVCYGPTRCHHWSSHVQHSGGEARFHSQPISLIRNTVRRTAEAKRGCVVAVLTLRQHPHAQLRGARAVSSKECQCATKTKSPSVAQPCQASAFARDRANVCEAEPLAGRGARARWTWPPRPRPHPV